MTIERLEEIEQQRKEAIDENLNVEYSILVEDVMPELINEIKRLKQALNEIAGEANKAINE